MEIILIGEELMDVKRFIGQTSCSYLFVSQRPGEQEYMVKVVPCGGAHQLSYEEAYKEATIQKYVSYILLDLDLFWCNQ